MSRSRGWGRQAVLATLLAVLMALAWTGSDGGSRTAFVVLAWGAGALHVVHWRLRDAEAGWRLRARHVWIGAVVLRLAFLAMPPSLSDDAYRYVWDGRLQVEGIDPYAHRPDAAALAGVRAEADGGALYEQLNSRGYYSVYPPASQLLFRAGVVAGDGRFAPSFVWIKLLLVLCELAGVWALARRASPGLLLLYLWHPLPLVEIAGQGHTEGAMVGALLLGLAALRHGKFARAGAALAVAVWVKLYPMLLVPVALRHGRGRLLAAGLAASLLVWLPFARAEAPVHMLDSLRLYVRLFEFNAGPYLLLKQLGLVLTGSDWSKVLGPVLAGLFGAYAAGVSVVAWRSEWDVARAALWLFGGYLAFSTTVHPWYLLAVLPLVLALGRPLWGWQWLALSSMGTYTFYTGGPYVLWIWVGWLGLGVWMLARHRDPLLQVIQRSRGREKAERVREAMRRLDSRRLDGRPRVSVLDLGAGEGYVGAALRAQGAEVRLADVIDLNRTDLPHVCYDGERLPMDDDAVDWVVLVYVLHHARDARKVLREADRVARRGVVVIESVYRSPLGLRILTRLDRLANDVRSSGAMRAQEAHLHFRTHEGWLRLFRALGLRVFHAETGGHVLHRTSTFVLEASQSSSHSG